MHTPSSHMNGGFYHEFNEWDPPFMWEEGASFMVLWEYTIISQINVAANIISRLQLIHE